MRNVWKPTDAEAKLPVVAWIYGGGFVNGGASPPTYSRRQPRQAGRAVRQLQLSPRSLRHFHLPN
ncbi:hypothetical protein ACRAWD_10420 [Caulobacter segnis]